MAQAATNTQSKSERSDLLIGGMNCAACVNRVQRRLGKMNGVGQVQVNFGTGKASVAHDERSLTTEAESLGYPVIALNKVASP